MRPPNDLALRLLREVRIADEDEGGLAVSSGQGWDDEESTEGGESRWGDEEREALADLVERGLIEYRSRYGEAPDGEEDELAAEGDGYYRITSRGVETLRDLGMSPR